MSERYFEEAIRLSRRETLVALGGVALWGANVGSGSLGATPSTGTDWRAISELFLIDRSLTYLNTGSLGSTPKPVLEARRAVELRLESNPVGEGFGGVLREAEAVAGKVAELIGSEVRETTLTRNTTEGMNFVAEGLNLQAGDRVLTSNNEHGGGLGAWKFLQKYRGVEINVAEIPSPPQSEDEIVENFQKRMTPKTRVIMCSHVTFSNGVLTPIARLSELAHAHGAVMIVDGAQSSGGVPVHVKQLGCDAYVSSGHKFLLGPKGTGFLYIRESSRDRIRPMQLDDGYGYYTAIRGTNSMPEAIGLGTVIDWFAQIGREAIYRRLMDLRNALYGVLEKTPHIKIDSPPPGSSMASHLVCFSVTDRDRYQKLQEQFARDKVIVKGVGINGIDHRLSVHLYNTEADVERFAESLRKGVA